MEKVKNVIVLSTHTTARLLCLALGAAAVSACGSESEPGATPGAGGQAAAGGAAGSGGASGGAAGSAGSGGSSGGAAGAAGTPGTECPEASTPPLLTDSFESGDMSATNADGFKWGKNNRTSVVTATHAIWHNGSVNNPIGADQDWTPFDGAHSLRFRYPALEAWSEQRFDLGEAYPEIWFRYWLRVPQNFVHENVTPGAHNNKFFALWMDGYSQHGEGPTLVWNFWGEDGGSSYFTYSISKEATGQKGHHGKYSQFIRPEDSGRWMQVVLYAKMSTSPTSNDGESRIWRRWQDECEFSLISETLERGLIAPASGPQGWAAGYVMGWSNSGYAEDTEWLMDQFTVSSSSLLPD